MKQLKRAQVFTAVAVILNSISIGILAWGMSK